MTDEGLAADSGAAWFAEGVPSALELAVGEEVRRPLPSAAGAGYAWSVRHEGGDVGAAELEIDVGLVPAFAGEPTNAPAPVALVALGLRPGRAVWRLVLARAWKPDAPLVDQAVEVDVRAVG